MICGLGSGLCLENLEREAGADHLPGGGSERCLLLWCIGAGEMGVFSKDHMEESVTGVPQLLFNRSV